MTDAQANADASTDKPSMQDEEKRYTDPVCQMQVKKAATRHFAITGLPTIFAASAA